MTMTISGDGSITGLVAGGLPDATVTTADILDANVTPAKLSQPLTFGTPVTCAGQTSIDFNIPSWARRITVMLSDVSISGTNSVIVQLGTAGSFETSGYVGGSWQANITITGNSSGFLLGNSYAAAQQVSEVLSIMLLDPSTNRYVAFGTGAISSGGNAHVQAGSKVLSAALTRVRVTTVGSTDTFDTTPAAGVINVMWE